MILWLVCVVMPLWSPHSTSFESFPFQFELLEQTNRVVRQNFGENVKVWTKVSTLFVSAGRNVNVSVRFYLRPVSQTT